jgi:hypothetical protein
MRISQEKDRNLNMKNREIIYLAFVVEAGGRGR